MIITLTVDYNGIHDYVKMDVEGIEHLENTKFLENILNLVKEENKRSIEKA